MPFRHLSFFWAFCFSLCSFGLFAQGWDQVFQPFPMDATHIAKMDATADGGSFNWLCRKLGDSTSIQSESWLLRSDPEGKQTLLAYVGTGCPIGTVRTTEGDFWVLTEAFIFIAPQQVESRNFLYRVSPAGQRLDSIPIFQNGNPLNLRLSAFAYVNQGGFLLAGQNDFIEPDTAIIWKISSIGASEWTIGYGQNIAQVPVFQEIIPIQNGKWLAVARAGRSAFLVRFNNDGTIDTDAFLPDFPVDDATFLQDGSIAMAGIRDEHNAQPDSLQVMLLDANFQVLWQETILAGYFEKTNKAHVSVLPNGEILAAFGGSTGSAAAGQVRVYWLDIDGNLLKDKDFGRNFGQNNECLFANAVLQDGSLFFGGSLQAIGQDSFPRPWLMLTDDKERVFSAKVQGVVRWDTDLNCVAEAQEYSLSGWIIEGSKAGQPFYYATSDAMGRYVLPLDTGVWKLRLLTPSSLWEVCSNQVEVIVAGDYEQIYYDFPVQAALDCPRLEVSMSNDVLRRCFENNVQVAWYNRGAKTANNAYVDVSLDPNLTLVNSVLTAQNLGNNRYRFALGDVEPNASNSFTMRVLVNCDGTVLGQTHCIEAHIFPDTLCPTPPGWSGAEIGIEAQCIQDSVRFVVQNKGTVPTTKSLDFVIAEDEILFRQGQIATGLPVGGDSVFVFPATGATYRFIAAQEPFFPFGDFTTAALEGCANANMPISLGFFTLFPESDYSPFVAKICRESVGSYDPNEKYVFPKGFDNEHFILPKTALDYQINFQNTGTDTAFTVVIRDTLSPWLDATSIRDVVSSHPVRWELMGTGQLKFTFENIGLPDSTTNETASHGYVHFRVLQRDSVPLGSVIYNRAGIYFDFNEPVITNEVFVTVDTGFWKMMVQTWEPEKDLPKASIAPNPAQDFLRITLPENPSKPFSFQIYDVKGTVVQDGFLLEKETHLTIEKLVNGIYFLKIKGHKTLIINKL
jgi:uncharacterized repeat protein (TIGR01451 family)